MIGRIYMKEPLDKGNSDFLVTLNPLIESPKLPKAKMVKTENIFRAQDFPTL